MTTEIAEKAARALFKITSLRRTITSLEAASGFPCIGGVISFQQETSTGELYIDCSLIDQKSFVGNIMGQLKQELSKAENELENLHEHEIHAES